MPDAFLQLYFERVLLAGPAVCSLHIVRRARSTRFFQVGAGLLRWDAFEIEISAVSWVDGMNTHAY